MPVGYDDRERAEEERDADRAHYDAYANQQVFNTQGQAPYFSDADRALAQFPIVGAQKAAEIAAAEAAWEADKNQQTWERLAQTAPSVQELTPDYLFEAGSDEYGDLMGPGSTLEGYGSSADQQAAQAALMNLYNSGGYTAQDTAAREQMRRVSAGQRGQQLRGANEAALQQSYARGQGGGGAELAARLSGSQAMIQGQAMGDSASEAAFQQAAQARALQALQAHQSGANTMQSQELSRRGALDAYNQQRTDWRRGRETRNTGWANREADARSTAYQQAYGNRERAVAGRDSQYSTDSSNRAAGNAAAERARSEQAAAAGGVLAEIF